MGACLGMRAGDVLFEYMFFWVVSHVTAISKFGDLSDLCVYDPRCLPEEVGPFKMDVLGG